MTGPDHRPKTDAQPRGTCPRGRVSQVHHVPIVYIPGCGRRPSSGSGVDEALGAVIVRPHARRLR